MYRTVSVAIGKLMNQEIIGLADEHECLAHKAEHAVDMETGAVIAVTLQGSHLGDTTTVLETAAEAGERIAETAEAANNEEVGERVDADEPAEIVTDKGYHSNAVLRNLEGGEVRSYIPEPDRGRREWKGKEEAERRAVYGNRRRIGGEEGRAITEEARRVGREVVCPHVRDWEGGEHTYGHMRTS